MCVRRDVVWTDIHFQYNSVLFGLLFLALFCVGCGHFAVGVALMVALVLSKHLFLFLLPPVGVFILRALLWPHDVGDYSGGVAKANAPGPATVAPKPLPRAGGGGLPALLSVGAMGVAVFAVVMWPFLSLPQLRQIYQRLFPFQR